MLDDPNALFSARWLTERMGVQTLILVRDPVGLLGSWKALDWKVRLSHWQAQPALMRDVLAPWADQIADAQDHGDWIDQMCCLWNVAHQVIDQIRTEVPNVTIRRYEDLAFDPMQQFADVYQWFGLDWSADAQRQVREATSTTTSGTRGLLVERPVANRLPTDGQPQRGVQGREPPDARRDPASPVLDRRHRRPLPPHHRLGTCAFQTQTMLLTAPDVTSLLCLDLVMRSGHTIVLPGVDPDGRRAGHLIQTC